MAFASEGATFVGHKSLRALLPRMGNFYMDEDHWGASRSDKPLAGLLILETPDLSLGLRAP